MHVWIFPLGPFVGLYICVKRVSVLDSFGKYNKQESTNLRVLLSVLTNFAQRCV